MLQKSLILVLTIIIMCQRTVFSQVTVEGNFKKQAETQKLRITSIQEDPNNSLGLAYAAVKIEEARQLVENKNYDRAEKILLEVSTWLTNITEQHYSLYKALENIKNKFGESKIEKAHALDSGRLRDETYLLLARVYIAQNKLNLAITLLVDIVKSQPGQKLGEEAYRLLQEIKFSDALR